MQPKYISPSILSNTGFGQSLAGDRELVGGGGKSGRRRVSAVQSSYRHPAPRRHSGRGVSRVPGIHRAREPALHDAQQARQRGARRHGRHRRTETADGRIESSQKSEPKGTRIAQTSAKADNCARGRDNMPPPLQADL